MGIKDLFKKAAGDKPKYRNKDRVERGEFRGHTMTDLVMPDTVRVIGERINPTGKKRFQQALKENDLELPLSLQGRR